MYPMLLQFGSVGLRTFPLVLAVAVLVGSKLAAAELRRRAVDPAPVQDLVVPSALLGLAAARLLHILLFDPGWYLAHPGDVLSLWSGGLAFQGALLAGLGTAAWLCWRRALPFWRVADSVAPGVALGQAIGAVGSLLNGSSYGTPTDLPWAAVFADPRGQAPLGVPVHPTQLYEVAAALLLFIGLWLTRRRLHRDGAVFLLYLLGASLLTPLEFLKGDALWIADVVPAAPVVSTAVLMVAVGLWSRRQPDRVSGEMAPTSGAPVSVREAEERRRERLRPGVSP